MGNCSDCSSDFQRDRAEIVEYRSVALFSLCVRCKFCFPLFLQPFETYQLDKISINKDAKKKFIEELPAEPKEVWCYKRRCGMLENIMQLIQNENTDEASKILNTLTKVCFMYIVFKSLLDRLPQGSKNMLKKKKEKRGKFPRWRDNGSIRCSFRGSFTPFWPIHYVG